MTKYRIISAFRSKINQPVYEEYISYKEAMSVDGADQRLEYHEFVEKFRKVVQTLPDTQRKVIVLSKIKGFSNKEIAEKLTLSEQTVKNSLSVGLKKLKIELDKICFLYVLLFVNFINFLGTV